MAEKNSTHRSARSRHNVVRCFHRVIPALFLFACAGEPVEPVAPEVRDFSAGAGARIAPRYVTTVDRQVWRFLQIMDTEIDQPCRFVQLDQRTQEAVCYPLAYGAAVYLDEDCTTLYVATWDGPGVIGADGYSPDSGFVRTGARVTAPGEGRFQKQSAGCFAASYSPEMPVYEIAERIDHETFQKGSFSQIELNATLGAEMINGADGSVLLNELIDRVADSRCEPSITEAGPRCVSLAPLVHDQGLRDTSCDRLVVPSYDVQTPVASVEERGGAIYRFQLYPGQDVGRVGESGQCMVEQFGHGRDRLFTGVPYPVEEWPELEYAPITNDRLTARIAELPNGNHGDAVRRVAIEAMFEDGGEPCGPMWIGNTLRCVPPNQRSDYSSLQLFADSSCTEPVHAHFGEDPEPETVTWRDSTGNAEQGHLPIGRVLRRGVEIPESDVHRLVPGSWDCVPVQLNARYFKLGSEVSGDDFAALRLVTGEKR